MDTGASITGKICKENRVRMQITRSQARRFLLLFQNLWPPHDLAGQAGASKARAGQAGAGKAGIMAYLQRVRCIQYDPLDIVGNNADLVLQARLGDYRPEMLRELLYQERRLLDGWDKLMSILPTEDWPYFRRQREAHQRKLEALPEQLRVNLPRVREAICQHGSLSALELKELGESLQGDWGWQVSLAKAALGQLYFSGELVVHHRVHTRKYYELVERCLTEDLVQADEPIPSESDYLEWRLLRRIGSVGMLWGRMGEAWLGLEWIKTPQRRRILDRLVSKGRLQVVIVEGVSEPFYIRRQDQDLLEQAMQTDTPEPRVAALAPLDNLIWDRRMLRELFEFTYSWEVYLPAAKRRYGYYVLPVLYGERFIARFEPGWDRKNRRLRIKNWWWEGGIEPSGEMHSALREWLVGFMGYCGASELDVEAEVVEQAGNEWLFKGVA